MTVRGDYDVVIVGAGVAGGALATRLARDGLSVLILERSRVHIDRIRGEWLAPWGVHEAAQLGIVDELVAAGGNYVSKFVRYAQDVPIEVARASPIDLGSLFPNVPGVMMLGHPHMCDSLDQAAQRAGATLLRGVVNVSVLPGLPPTIAFQHKGDTCTVRPRLVVGADGRGSSVGRQVGAETQTEPVHHLIAGLLIDGVDAWPEDEQALTVQGGAYLLVFPQGRGRMRLYLCYSLEERARFAGRRAAANFLEAFRVPFLPHADDIAGARVAGPCQGYPNADTWVDVPMAPGVVLIGDAAGHNDPTIGQGLSITMRDVHLVSDALSRTADWDESLFIDYATERRERMRRLRVNARLVSKLRCEFDREGDLRRIDVMRRATQDRSAALPLMVPFLGPFGVPDETFEEPALKKLFGDEWSLTKDGRLQQSTAGKPQSEARQ